jgi:hypothetical protein
MNRASHVAAHAENRRLLAAGYSCRSQVKLVDGLTLPHPAQALLACLLPQRLMKREQACVRLYGMPAGSA